MHILHSLFCELKEEFANSRKSEELRAWFVYTFNYSSIYLITNVQFSSDSLLNRLQRRRYYVHIIEEGIQSFVPVMQKQTDYKAWFSASVVSRTAHRGKNDFIKTEIHRVECKECKVVRQVEIGFADLRMIYTKFLARYVRNLARFMTISDVSKHLGLSWDLIKSIQKRYTSKEV